MSLNKRFFCDAVTDELITSFVQCAFKPAETKRAFLVRKGFKIDNPGLNINFLSFWENAIAAGDVIPLPDGVFVDVTQNPQEGTIGTKTIKLSDGETAVSYQASLPPCLLSQLARLESNSSPYDVFFITAIPQLIGRYYIAENEGGEDVIYPIVLNSIDVRSKPLANDGTAVEGIQDTIILRYNEVQSKNVRYFDLDVNISNLTGLRAVAIDARINSADVNTLRVRVVTECEGIPVNDLTEITDIKIDGSTGDPGVTDITSEGDGWYLLTTTEEIVPGEEYIFSIPTTASNNESFTLRDYTYVI